MPRGTDTYKGLGLPNQGNPNLKAASTDDAFTITGSSGGPGPLLVIRTNPSTAAGSGQDSTLVTGDQVRISSLGAIQLTSGSSVVQTFSTAGIVGGAESTLQAWAIDSSGRYSGLKRETTALTSALATTVFTLQSSDSGKTVVYNATSGGMTIALPTTAVPAGCEYEIIQNTGTASVMQITSSGSNMDVVLAGGAQNSSGPSTADALAPGSTAAQGCRVVAITTARWFLQPYVSLRVGFTSATMEGAGTWVAGTTIA